MTREQLIDFVRESNHIEGINRSPTNAEVDATDEFVNLEQVATESLVTLVKALQPDAVLRDRVGLNVRVGQHFPLKGGHEVVYQLENLLYNCNQRRDSQTAFRLHWSYETLHPFTDGNGRSGRALWLWLMQSNAPLGFLHTWYYQSLQYNRS